MSIPDLCVRNLQIHSEIAKVNQVMIITLLQDQQWQLQQLQPLQSELQNLAEEIMVKLISITRVVLLWEGAKKSQPRNWFEE